MLAPATTTSARRRCCGIDGAAVARADIDTHLENNEQQIWRVSNKNNAARLRGLVVRECKRMHFESLFNAEREKGEGKKRCV